MRRSNDSLASTDMQARFAELGLAPATGTPEQFAAFFMAETQKSARIVAAAHIGAELPGMRVRNARTDEISWRISLPPFAHAAASGSWVRPGRRGAARLPPHTAPALLPL